MNEVETKNKTTENDVYAYQNILKLSNYIRNNTESKNDFKNVVDALIDKLSEGVYDDPHLLK